MKAMILGSTGQLGQALIRAAPNGAHLTCHSRCSLDLTDRSAVEAALEKERPHFVFNAAAYTAVDRAETDECAAFEVNATAVGILAEATRGIGAHFVHVSTDFVFDGKFGSPYAPNAPTNPLNVYGRTKAAGEKLAGGDALIVRTSWVYSSTGANFVRTMLRLMSEREELRVVADQVGTPTFASGLAMALWKLATRGASGVYHYTDTGVASWYDFAVAIQDEGVAAGLLRHKIPVIPVGTEDFPTPAQRPAFSVLDKTATFSLLGEFSPHWRNNLRTMITQLADGN